MNISDRYAAYMNEKQKIIKKLHPASNGDPTYPWYVVEPDYNDDEYVACIVLNTSYEKYVEHARRFDSEILDGFVYFPTKEECQNFINSLIDIVNSEVKKNDRE